MLCIDNAVELIASWQWVCGSKWASGEGSYVELQRERFEGAYCIPIGFERVRGRSKFIIIIISIQPLG